MCGISYFLFFCGISCFLFSRGFPISCFSLGFLFFYWRVFVLDGKKRMELGTKELQSSLVRGSVAPAAAGLGDKRNLSFRAVRFQKTFFQLKTMTMTQNSKVDDFAFGGSVSSRIRQFYYRGGGSETSIFLGAGSPRDIR